MLGIALVTDMLAEGIVNTCNSVNYGYKRKKKKKRLVKITQLKLINKNNYYMTEYENLNAIISEHASIS